MTVSGSLVQVKGWQRSFQASMKRSMAAIRSATVGKLPRRRAWRVMIEKKASTRFSQEPEVGGKCQGSCKVVTQAADLAGCRHDEAAVGCRIRAPPSTDRSSGRSGLRGV